MFNLLEERWLPVVRADDSLDRIAPWELAPGERGEPPPVDLAPARADFRAGLMEFLVGLLQTALAPRNSREWRERHEQPPTPEELRAALAPHRPFFNLLGERPLFMQDFELAPCAAKDAVDISALLVDAPGGNTLKNNGDFFVKRGRVQALCPACAAMALFTLQDFAPSGGKGHRTSLRGGGPLSTLVDGDTLWEKVWRNVLPVDSPLVRDAAAPGPGELPGRVYPWAAPTRTSEKGQETHPADVHFLHAFWAIPRRILLLPEEEAAPVLCDLCAVESLTIIRRYATRPSGYNYGPTWLHPLTPYRHQGPDKPRLSVKGTANIAGYQHWLGLVYGRFGGQFGGQIGGDVKGVRRADCVTHALKNLPNAENKLRVRACGYDMDNMKPLQFCESVFPVYDVPEERLPDFREGAGMLVAGADQVRRNLVSGLKEALVAKGKEAKADATLFENVSTAFWGRTEAEFYCLARELAACEDFGQADPLREHWAKVLQRTAVVLFEEETFRARLQPEHLKRQMQALQKMRNYNRVALRKTLSLPDKA